MLFEYRFFYFKEQLTFENTVLIWNHSQNYNTNSGEIPLWTTSGCWGVVELKPVDINAGLDGKFCILNGLPIWEYVLGIWWESEACYVCTMQSLMSFQDLVDLNIFLLETIYLHIIKQNQKRLNPLVMIYNLIITYVGPWICKQLVLPTPQ